MSPYFDILQRVVSTTRKEKVVSHSIRFIRGTMLRVILFFFNLPFVFSVFLHCPHTCVTAEGWRRRSIISSGWLDGGAVSPRHLRRSNSFLGCAARWTHALILLVYIISSSGARFSLVTDVSNETGILSVMQSGYSLGSEGEGR
jgi:hypothetical protein